MLLYNLTHIGTVKHAINRVRIRVHSKYNLNVKFYIKSNLLFTLYKVYAIIDIEIERGTKQC